MGDILYLFIIVLGAAVYPRDTRVIDGCEIFFERAVDQAVDPAILVEEDAETQRDGPVDG